jgi:hypothetical protein
MKNLFNVFKRRQPKEIEDYGDIYLTNSYHSEEEMN